MVDEYKFTPPITRRNHGRGHSYRDATGRKVPGVTTVLKAYPKAALIGWASRTAAATAVDNWDKLDEMTPTQRYEYIRRGPDREKTEKGMRGTQLHKLAVPLSEGKEVVIPDEQFELVESYVKFLDEFRVVTILTEFAVVSHQFGYAGTADLIAELWNPELQRHEVWLLDIKTSSGVYPDNALQLAAYRYADKWVDKEGKYHPIPYVTRTGIVHIRQDDYDVIPVDTEGDVFAHFVHVRHTYDFTGDFGYELIGEPLPHPALEDEKEAG